MGMCEQSGFKFSSIILLLGANLLLWFCFASFLHDLVGNATGKTFLPLVPMVGGLNERCTC